MFYTESFFLLFVCLRRSGLLDKESEEAISKQKEWKMKSYRVVRGFGDFHKTQIPGA